MEKQAPWFFSDSSQVPLLPFQFQRTAIDFLIEFDWILINPTVTPTVMLELRWNCSGTGLEL